MISPNLQPEEDTPFLLSDAELVMQRCETLGGISEETGILTRRFASGAMLQVNSIVSGWMQDAGMAVRVDSIGNLLGRYVGEGEKTVMLGSHLDTVRDAGMYDGPLGVIAAIACVSRIQRRGAALPFSIEVAAFADEEGLRFGTAYLGSRALTGTLDPAYLDLQDANGIPMREAITAFGGDPDALLSNARPGAAPDAYLEIHIEQGPVLEALGLPVGIVSGISGQNRAKIVFEGEAGHAGTVPMHMRRDALSAAAEFITHVEQMALNREGLVATVGQLQLEPGASNVIPGKVTLSLDVRHLDNTARLQAVAALETAAVEICTKRRISLVWEPMQETATIECDPQLTEALAGAISRAGYSPYRMPSGAGHDAVTMSAVAPVAMLFVRCKGGISHNPAESVTVEDVAAALRVIELFLAAQADSAEQG